VRVGSTFDSVNESRDFREEGVIIGERVPLLVIISRSSTMSAALDMLRKKRWLIPDIEGRLLVRIHQSHVESICPNL
jgi:hypothetical protein